MNKIKTCVCIEDYKITCREYISPKLHSEIYMKTIFVEGQICYYKIDDDIYYIADSYEHLVRMLHYNSYVEDMNKKQFEYYFENY